MDDVTINRLYYEMVDPTKPTKQPKKDPSSKSKHKPKKIFNSGLYPKKAMTITKVGQKAKSRLFDYKEEHDAI